MKLKYYFRGLGTGILFATIVLFISYSYRMSDSQIKKKAEELGMVYAGNVDESTGMFGDKTTEDEITTDRLSSDETSSSEEATTTPTETETESKTEEVTTEPPTTEVPTTETPTTTEPPTTETPTTSSSINTTKCEIKVGDSTSSYDVAYALHAAGLIDNIDEFDNYLCNNGYATKIQNGTYTITSDMTFEDIAKLITTRRY